MVVTVGEGSRWHTCQFPSCEVPSGDATTRENLKNRAPFLGIGVRGCLHEVRPRRVKVCLMATIAERICARGAA
jgi:hypothetical protein